VDRVCKTKFSLCLDQGTFYCDLSSTEWLFEGQGDTQFDTYRSMRKANKNNWAAVRLL
jgi:hypothetical protein